MTNYDLFIIVTPFICFYPIFSGLRKHQDIKTNDLFMITLASILPFLNIILAIGLTVKFDKVVFKQK